MHVQHFTLSNPFHEINIDLIGEYTPTILGHKYIIIAINQLSNFVVAIPLSDRTAESVAAAFIRSLLLTFQ